MKKEILLLSSSFMGLCDNLSNVFAESGYKVTLLKRKEPKVSFFKKILFAFFSFFKEKFKHFEQEGVNEISEKVKTIISHNSNIIIVDYLGINLNKDALETIQGKTKIVKIMGDSIDSYPYLKGSLCYYDLVVTYEHDEVDKIKKYTKGKVSFLNACYDQSVYKPLYIDDKTIDICFVGKLFPKEHSRRRHLLEKLIKDFPNLRIEIYGIYAKKYQLLRFLKWRIIDGGKKFKNRIICQQEVNNIYNKSKLVLNINSFQTHNDWSSRLVEILGSGATCVSEYTKASYQFFSEYCLFFKSYSELRQIIDDCFSKGIPSKNGLVYVKNNFSLLNYVYLVEEECANE